MKCSVALVRVCLLGFCACGWARAQQSTAQSEQIIDRRTGKEKSLVERWSQYLPIAETYIQELAPHGDKLVVVRDHYFLSQAKLGPRVDVAAFKRTQKGNRARHVAGNLFDAGMEYIPAGFVQMAHPSTEDFDRQHYSFQPIRSETLNTGNFLVFEVTPLRQYKSRAGMFRGQIWVEDETYAIVR